MKSGLSLLLAVLTFSLSSVMSAQAPAGAPAGANGLCNDGTYSMRASKRGACRGHQGVKQWFAADAPAPAKTAPSTSVAPASAPVAPAAAAPSSPSAPSTGSAPAPAQKQAAHSNPSTIAPASGGGPGMVWLNAKTNVYHCSTDSFYGKTKSGKYESEAEAKAAGARPAHGKTCN